LYIPKILEVCSVQDASIFVYNKALEYRDMSISLYSSNAIMDKKSRAMDTAYFKYFRYKEA